MGHIGPAGLRRGGIAYESWQREVAKPFETQPLLLCRRSAGDSCVSEADRDRPQIGGGLT